MGRKALFDVLRPPLKHELDDSYLGTDSAPNPKPRGETCDAAAQVHNNLPTSHHGSVLGRTEVRKFKPHQRSLHQDERPRAVILYPPGCLVSSQHFHISSDPSSEDKRPIPHSNKTHPRIWPHTRVRLPRPWSQASPWKRRPPSHRSSHHTSPNTSPANSTKPKLDISAIFIILQHSWMGNGVTVSKFPIINSASWSASSS